MHGKLLLDTITRDLLKEFGAGSHSPGSGSAVAFEGILAAYLTCTVIDLTEKKKRLPSYRDHVEQLVNFRALIHSQILPALETLFQEDSEQFDRVIKAQIAANRETDPIRKSDMQVLAEQQLRMATELPMKIAQYCYKLGTLAKVVFDHGFVKARGDSAAAVHKTVSAMLGCLSIIDLNLSTLPADDWMDKARKYKNTLKARYEELQQMSLECHKTLEKENEEHWQYEQRFKKFRAGNMADQIKSEADLENLVRDLLNSVWIDREKIWKKEENRAKDLLDIIEPHEILNRVFGYDFKEDKTLGMHVVGDDIFEIAGTIDKAKKQVRVSQRFPVTTRRFTAAHELAHLILHDQVVLHRDRAIDGSSSHGRNKIEIQADKFAAFLLMPATLVRDALQEIFEMPVFVINEDSVRDLGQGTILDFRRKCVDRDGLALELVKATRYGGKVFTPLAEFFGVSEKTMAIRLIELNLVKF